MVVTLLCPVIFRPGRAAPGYAPLCAFRLCEVAGVRVAADAIGDGADDLVVVVGVMVGPREQAQRLQDDDFSFVGVVAVDDGPVGLQGPDGDTERLGGRWRCGHDCGPFANHSAISLSVWSAWISSLRRVMISTPPRTW